MNPQLTALVGAYGFYQGIVNSSLTISDSSGNLIFNGIVNVFGTVVFKLACGLFIGNVYAKVGDFIVDYFPIKIVRNKEYEYTQEN